MDYGEHGLIKTRVESMAKNARGMWAALSNASFIGLETYNTEPNVDFPESIKRWRNINEKMRLYKMEG